MDWFYCGPLWPELHPLRNFLGDVDNVASAGNHHEYGTLAAALRTPWPETWLRGHDRARGGAHGYLGEENDEDTEEDEKDFSAISDEDPLEVDEELETAVAAKDTTPDVAVDGADESSRREQIKQFDR